MPEVVENMDALKALFTKAGDKAVIIDFYADWCGPCKQIAPKFNEFAEKYSNIVTCKVNVDDADDIAQDCKVEAMPTFMVFKNGQQVDSLLGANVGKLEELFQKYN